MGFSFMAPINHLPIRLKIISLYEIPNQMNRNHWQKLKSNNIIIPVIYGILGILWILLSDHALFSLSYYSSIEMETIHSISYYKGYFYVVLTTALLYVLLRKHTNRILAITEDFRRLFEHHPHPMMIYRLDNYNILIANTAACNEYGYSADEFSRLSLYDLRPESEHAKLHSHLLNVTNQEYTNSGIWLHKRKSGNTFYVNVFSHATTYQDVPCRIVVVLNVHQYILAEQERKQLETHQTALLKDLSEYAFLTSHELRGPLARILGLTALFNMGEDPALVVEKLQEEATAMDQVIRQMNNTLMRNSHELISRQRAQFHNKKSPEH